MLTLYQHRPCPECLKVRLLASHLSLVLRKVEVSPFQADSTEPWILQKNPTGSIPVLETDGGVCIAEANAILTFLADGTTYYPDDQLTRAQIIRWMIFEQRRLPRSIGAIKYWIDTDDLDQLSSDRLLIEKAIGNHSLSILDAELASKPFIAGDKYTIADISIFAYCHIATDAEFDLSGKKNLTAWLARVQQQLGFGGKVPHCENTPCSICHNPHSPMVERTLVA